MNSRSICRSISKPERTGKHQLGFLRLELVVSFLAIIVLFAIIIPLVQHAREVAHQTECRNTLRILTQSLHNYHDVYTSFPLGCVGSTSLPPEKRWSWYLGIGNYWGHYGTPVIDYERSWDDPGLRPLQLHTWRNGLYEEFDIPLWAPPIIKCPNGTPARHVDGQPFADYVGVSGLGGNSAMLSRSSPHAGIWAYDECSSMQDITDGTSNTALAIETARDNGCWLAGGPSTVRGYVPDKGAMGPDGQFGGLHAGASMTVFADGHVRFLSNSTDPKIISSIMTLAGREAPLPDDE